MDLKTMRYEVDHVAMTFHQAMATPPNLLFGGFYGLSGRMTECDGQIRCSCSQSVVECPTLGPQKLAGERYVGQ